MFYMEGWVPLVDVLDQVSAALKKRYTVENRKDEVGSESFDHSVYEATWRICDRCLTSIIGPHGTAILLSKKLFTRSSNKSQFGDCLCLTIGQLGSGYRAPWFEDVDPNPYGAIEVDLTPLSLPYLYHHVMVRDDRKRNVAALCGEA